ncbi:MAG: hypothetical protein ACUVV0_04080 [Anaerolineae bacterium]
MATNEIAYIECGYNSPTLPLPLLGRPKVLTPKQIVNALGPCVGSVPPITLHYRVKGEDTLTWGDQSCWIEIKGIGSLLSLPPLEGHPDEEFIRNYIMRYSALLDVSSFLDDMRQLEEIYSFRNDAAVQRFLYSYPQLAKVLLEAHVYLKKHFGPEPQVTLEVVSDPEVEGWDELFAYILTSLPVDEALARLNRLDEEWFLDQLDRVDGLLNFNLEFV